MDLKILQLELSAMGVETGAADGIVGPLTGAAVAAVLSKAGIERWRSWSWARRLIAAEQLVYRRHGIDSGEIDGLVGPQTLHAREAFSTLRATGQLPTWRDERLLPLPEDALFPRQVQIVWPVSSKVPARFGAIGRHQAMLELPFAMRLAWDLKTRVTRFSIHEMVHDSALRVLDRVLGNYGEREIRRLHLDLFGGCLHVRRMRGGSAWSMHSWGIAIDFDPAGNQLHWGRDRARLAQPAYAPFWRLWAEEGWLSLGHARDFDWMHVQAARL
jgi:hypothetical protein